MKNVYFVLIIFIGTFTQLNAQDLTFEKIGISEGLPVNYTLTIFEDKKGYLWIGTIGGLAKYDGTTIKTYTTQDGLNSNVIRAINEDKDNNIWVGTERGVCKIMGDTIQSYYLDSARHENTEDIFINDSGNIYIANEIGLYIYNSKLDTFTKHPLVNTEVINTIISDNHNNLWYGSRHGLFRILKDSVQQIYITGNSEKHNNSVVSSLKDCYGNLWFGTIRGFVKWQNDSLYTFNQNLGLENAFPKLNQLSDSSFLFGTYGGGIISFKNPKNIVRQTLSNNNQLSNIVTGITQTKGGRIWLATTTGLLKQNKIAFSEEKNFTDSLKNDIFAIKKDFNNNYWFATNNGVKKYNAN